MTPQDSARGRVIAPALRPRPIAGAHRGANGFDVPVDRGLNGLPSRRS